MLCCTWMCRNDVAVTCDWAPDGRHFLTATIAPRLNVDNGYQIWRCPSCLLVLCNMSASSTSPVTSAPAEVLGITPFACKVFISSSQVIGMLLIACITQAAAEMHNCNCRYTGEKVLDTKVEKLLEACWQPAPAGAYPDLPQSPRAQASTSGKASTSAAPPQKQGAAFL